MADDEKPAKKTFVPWTKDRIIAMYQAVIKSLPTTSSPEVNCWKGVMEHYCKIRGFYVKEEENTKDDGIIIIPQSESAALWEKTLQLEQARAFADAEDSLSADTGVTEPSGGDQS